MSDTGSAMPSTAGYLAQLRSDARRVAEVVGVGPLDAPVPACPGWDLGQLVSHLGGVHRWALHAVREAERPDGRPDRYGPEQGTDLGSWLVEGADVLASAIETLGDDAPSWNPWGATPVVGFWARRQALETMVHRWDAEAAVGSTTPLPPELASDAIDELFDVVLRRSLAREGAAVPPGSLHVHCTDVHGEWLVEVVDGVLRLRREHAKGDAALRGPAETLALHLWGRTATLPPAADVVGDAAVATAWARLTG